MNTWKDKKNIVLVLLAVACIVVIGCNSLLDGVTPGIRHPLSAVYKGDPNSAGLTSLLKLRQDRTLIRVQHRSMMLDLKRLAEDETYASQDAVGFIDQSIKDSQAFQDAVVGSPSNPFSILGVLATAGLAGAAGRAMKRKGDKDENEVEVEVVKRMNGGPADRGAA